MAFSGSINPLEVGMRVLLSPPASNILLRTACSSVGIAMPVYSTFKAIETKNPEEQQRCLLYWAAFGSFTLCETITDKLIYWFPFYYHMKFAFLVWLQLPSTDGATQIYMKHLRPFLLRHQVKLDRIGRSMYDKMSKYAAAHVAEFQFVKKVVSRILGAANQTVREILDPGSGHAEEEQDDGSESLRED